MKQAKQNILSRLKASKEAQHRNTSDASYAPRKTYTYDQMIQFFTRKLEENHVDVYHVDSNNWLDTFRQILKQTQSSHCLVGQGLEHQALLIEAMSNNKSVQITRYNAQYEILKNRLFHDIDISLTLAQAAIADTGTLVILPNEHEPRMMSLIPAIHVVLLREEQIVGSFSELISRPPWQENEDIPSNILFISSPSKTADIQQTLAYGAHGPKQLIVLIQKPDHS